MLDEIVYFVRWVDSASPVTSGWHDADTTVHPSTCTTVGYKIDEGDDYLTLAQSRDQDGNWNGAVAIPRSAVLEMKAWDPVAVT